MYQFSGSGGGLPAVDGGLACSYSRARTGAAARGSVRSGPQARLHLPWMPVHAHQRLDMRGSAERHLRRRLGRQASGGNLALRLWPRSIVLLPASHFYLSPLASLFRLASPQQGAEGCCVVPQRLESATSK